MVVILSNLNIAPPQDIGGDLSSGNYYRTIAQLASAEDLANLGTLYNNEEYTFSIDSSGDYLFKTSQTETIISRSTRKDTIKYIVREGESLNSLATDFGLTALTIKHANNLRSNTLRVGQELRIPPIDGVFVTVKKNDTLSSIATRYKVNVEDIQNYNGLLPGDPIFSGNELLIPGAVVSNTSSSSGSGSVIVPSFSPVPYSGKFIWPTESPTHFISQGVRWGHVALDLNRLNGWGIYASASGVVRTQNTRGGYGNLIIINHGDGWSTYYAHLSEFRVKPGDYVQQGQLIGIMGSTGRSTGPHLHFEIRRNGRTLNPLDYLPR
ncbi:MAG: M23 family metallopeptidase [Patescibacteria group bacterium]|nr:M23 family metallopeptidase [Patescibacteria group bacterium]